MATLITKNSSTASSVPTAAQLVQGELAVNVTDKRLFTENSSGTVVELGTNPSTLALPNGTANGVAYLNGSKVLTTGSALTFDGTNLVNTAGSVRLTNASGYFETALSYYLNAGGGGGFQLKGLGSGVQGIAFLDAGASSEYMRLTSTGLGIGTSSPREKLDVAGNIAAPFSDNSTIQFQYLTGSSYGLGMMADATNRGLKLFTRSADGVGYISFSTGGMTERMRLDYSGNLGLGVTPSAWASNYRVLQMRESYAALASDNGNGVAELTSNAYNDGSWRYANSSVGAVRYQANAVNRTHAWFTAPSGTAGNAISFSQVMTLDASGNLGIGTSSPLSPLNIQQTGDTLTNGLTLSRTGANRGTIFLNASDDTFRISRGATESLVISSAGNLGLGVTPSAWWANTKALQVGAGMAIEARTSDATVFSIGANQYIGASTNRIYLTSNVASLYEQNTGQHRWYTAPSGTAGNAITFTQALTLDANRNLLLNGTSAGASSVGTFTIFNGTAPTGSVTDGVILFAADVSSSSELRVRDEAGNVTTLSPHNFSLIPEGPSEELAWAYYSEKGGKRINVDMLKLARMVEKLTGEKLVYES